MAAMGARAARSIPERVAWAVETMAIRPTDRLLEIGCGRGVAAWLACEKLAGGKIMAIDRSATMVRLAAQRNADNIAAGKAMFRATALDAANLDGERFDKIFAINVNLFWVRSASPEIELVRRVLTPEGTLYLFHQPPSAARAYAIVDRVVAFLTEHRFTTTTLMTTTRTLATVLCVVARA
jgi:cyclopropane fatty-acyl-phospholipid synthase-like methyltransferase